MAGLNFVIAAFPEPTEFWEMPHIDRNIENAIVFIHG
jgi:hypothetical protein